MQVLIEAKRTKPNKTHTPNRVILHAAGEYLFNEDLKVWQHFSVFFPYLWEHYGICYHSAIDPGGTEVVFLKDNIIAGHALGHNSGSIGRVVIVPGAHTEPTLRKAISKPYLSDIQYQKLLEVAKRDKLPYTNHDLVDKRYRANGEKEKIDPGAGFLWKQFLKEIGQ